MAAQLDIIIPVFNEAESLVSLVTRINAALKKARISYNLIFVDDHSTDSTLKRLINLKKRFPIKILEKVGQKGKAFSILEGAQVATAEYIVMIDADLQYPPEIIPAMYEKAKKHGVVVGHRRNHQEPAIRHMLSLTFMHIWGRLLHGLKCDVQSGLKLFRRDIIDRMNPDEVTAWTLDIPLLLTAKDLGYSIGEVDIDFAARERGDAKIPVLRSIWEIGSRAVLYKFRLRTPYIIKPEKRKTMLGAGVIYNGKTFVTHTTLHNDNSALNVVTRKQKRFIFLLLLLLALAFIFRLFLTAEILVGILSFVYFTDMMFNLYVIMHSLHQPPEIGVSPKELAALKSSSLPIYTILCPLYKEAHVLPQFVRSIARIDWPKQKLDVILLLEADDIETIEVAKKMDLPSYIRILVVPDSQPKTKPKACNYGLHYAKGEYLVVYDAEDTPDPLQLKKVLIAFHKSNTNVKCIQAKLNFYNPHQNLLTRFFTAEYSLWFDAVLTGLQSIATILPLGGTSNHFRTQELRELEGWDPFNVTEDADLGVRLFKRGGLTAIIDSVTLEEANSSWRNWLRQRSRWIKGYMQTYLVHMRDPKKFFKEYGLHALLFQLIIGGKIAFMLINPLMWLLTITYFALYAWVGPTISALYPSVIFYMAVSSLVFGNFLFIYYYMIGAARREHWSILKWTLLIPIYWLMVSIAGSIALYQLIVKPHFWEKTVHGLHLKKETLAKQAKAVVKETVVEIAAQSQVQPHVDYKKLFIPTAAIFTKMQTLQEKVKRLSLKKAVGMLKDPTYLGGLAFIVATMFANLLNLANNVYLGNALNFEQFGLFSLVVSLCYLVSIPINAYGSAVNYRASYLFGKHQSPTLYHFWRYTRTRAVMIAIFFSLVWVAVSSFLPSVFHTNNAVPFLTFAFFILFTIVETVDISYLTAKLDYFVLAAIVLVQPAVRLLSGIALSKTFPADAYLSVFIGVIAIYFIGWLVSRKQNDKVDKPYEFHLPRRFFLATLLAGFSSIAFFSLDNILVAHFMSPTQVGQYSFLGLFGKMIFFVGNLAASFLAPLVARSEGAGKNSKKIFTLTIISVACMTALGYVVFGLGVYVLGPIYFAAKIAPVRNLLPIYGIGISAFTLAQVIVSYHLVKRHYVFPAIGLVLSTFEILGLFLFHQSLAEVVTVMTAIGITHFVVFLVLHMSFERLAAPMQNIRDFMDLLTTNIASRKARDPKKLRILFLNWRDTKHAWAGGSEAYIHELAQELVKSGHSVTEFCGNDGHSKHNEDVDGVQVIRHGGFYTVYFWAAAYYIFKLHRHVDVVIDSENGLPFFTPLFVRKPIYLLIHHVHQEYFRTYLRFPINYMVGFMEGMLMPLLYRRANIITVSDSSKAEILKLGLGTPHSISVINPGIHLEQYKKQPKTKQPSFCYVGRLKAYKNIDVAIRAFAGILKDYPTATFTIGGVGEGDIALRKLVNELKLNKQVSFVGKITDAEKIKLFGESWVAVQPSMIEGWGITVIEANACGTPVIASNINGLKDSTQHGVTGLLVPVGDVNTMQVAMRALLSNRRLREKFSRDAVGWANNFRWQNSGNALDVLLRQGFIPHRKNYANVKSLT